MFCHFWQIFEKLKWSPFLKNFLNVVYWLDIPGSKISKKSLYLQRLSSILLRYPKIENSEELALSPTVKEREAIMFFATFYLALKWLSLTSEKFVKAK